VWRRSRPAAAAAQSYDTVVYVRSGSCTAGAEVAWQR
jgi:hypothetical protein